VLPSQFLFRAPGDSVGRRALAAFGLLLVSVHPGEGSQPGSAFLPLVSLTSRAPSRLLAGDILILHLRHRGPREPHLVGPFGVALDFLE